MSLSNQKHEIRQACVDDASQLIALFGSLDRETDFMLVEPGERDTSVATQVELIKKFLQSPDQLLLVAVANEQVVGFLGATGGQTKRTRHVVSFAMGVKQALWGQGIGPSLLFHFEAWAHQHGYRRIEMTVVETNKRAQRLYLKNGYEIEGNKRCSLQVKGILINEFYMAKLMS